MSRKKVLLISYYWYPFAGVGVYRVSRFAKYLKKAGWDIVILTTKKASSGMQAEPDDPLLKDIKVYQSAIIEPTGLLSSKNDKDTTSNPSIFYNKNASFLKRWAVWVRLNLMIPDAKFTWKWFAVPLGKKIIKEEEPDIILSTSPPPTTSLIARDLAKWSGLPWVADFRDPWTNIYYYDDNPQSTWARNENKKLEASVLNSANRITLVNNGFFPEYELSDKATVIPNGFDSDQISHEFQKNKSSEFTIRYFGSLKANQYPTAFIQALKNLHIDYSENAQKVVFELYGSVDPSIKEDLKSLSGVIEIRFFDFISHDKMMKLISSTDLLLLVIGKTKNSKFVLSTKVFEYMTSGNPILGVGPLQGAAAELVRNANIGRFFSHQDPQGITNFINEVIKAKNEGKVLFEPDQSVINNYDFSYLTKKLERIMESQIGE